VMVFSIIARLVFVPQMGKAGEQLAQRIQQDLDDGIVSITPSIDVDEAQLASITTEALTHEQ